MRCALVSLDQRWQDQETNFLRCAEFAHTAKKQGCDAVIFPEMTLTGYSLHSPAIIEAKEESETLKRFGRLAKETELTLIFGAVLRDPVTERPSNYLCAASSDGTSRALYAKIHPFSFAGEEKVFAAGECLGFVDIKESKLGASVCYDLRFPELYAALANRCQAAVVIANWPQKRIAHWRALLIARAIENQFYMIGVNRIGTDGNDLHYEKSSLVVSPDGIVLTPLIAGDELDIYEIDLNQTLRYRVEFPTLRDKRTHLYREFLGSSDAKR